MGSGYIKPLFVNFGNEKAINDLHKAANDGNDEEPMDFNYNYGSLQSTIFLVFAPPDVVLLHFGSILASIISIPVVDPNTFISQNYSSYSEAVILQAKLHDQKGYIGINCPLDFETIVDFINLTNEENKVFIFLNGNNQVIIYYYFISSM